MSVLTRFLEIIIICAAIKAFVFPILNFIFHLIKSIFTKNRVGTNKKAGYFKKFYDDEIYRNVYVGTKPVG